MVARPDESASELRLEDVAEVQSVEELALVLRELRRREARRREGAELTYRHLAGQAGWSHAVVAAYLTGKTLPPTDRFDTLIQLLGANRTEQGVLATARDRVEERRRALARSIRPEHGLPVPRQLPADIPGFVGRTTELAALGRLVEAARRAPTVVITAITGTAGVGKTALAIHGAHQVKHRFAHGQLYADLRGFGPERPASPERILDGYLAALGVPPSGLPTDLDAKAALYRSLLDGQRLLVVLDNAASAQQIRPLLPATPGCLVLVTSRNSLTGLVARDRAHRIGLDVLPVNDSVALLAGFLGGARITAEPTAAVELARMCACLPTALCAAGERAAARSHATVASLAKELATAEHRLDPLDAGDDDRGTALREVFSWSYRRLPPDAARLFRLLGRYAGPYLDRSIVATLAGTEPAEADRLVDMLVAASMIQPEHPDRFRLHDLLRAYARELSDEVTPPRQAPCPGPERRPAERAEAKATDLAKVRAPARVPDRAPRVRR
jgi:transcriptional regulator with XRE-family HTH domain